MRSSGRCIALRLAAAAVFALSVAFAAPAQQRVAVDYDAIRRVMAESPEYYDSLEARFIEADTTLTLEELSILYYGLFFLDVEHRQGAIDYDIYRLRCEDKYEQACLLGEQSLAVTPASMVLIQAHIPSLWGAGRAVEEVESYLWRYRALMRAIKASGDGRSKATAFKVMEADSESALIRELFDGYPRKYKYKTDWDKRITRYKVTPSGAYPYRVLYIDFNSPD